MLRRMKKIFLLFSAIASMMLSSCSEKKPTDLTKTSFIPKPVSVEAIGDAFKIKLLFILKKDSKTKRSIWQCL